MRLRPQSKLPHQILVKKMVYKATMNAIATSDKSIHKGVAALAKR